MSKQAMTFDELLVELLEEDLKDWSDAAWVMGIVIEFGDRPEGPEQDELALTLIRTLIEQRLMVAGDLSEEGFREWGLEPDAAFARIEREWRALGRRPSLGEVCWLSNTEHGDAFARARPAPATTWKLEAATQVAAANFAATESIFTPRGSHGRERSKLVSGPGASCSGSGAIRRLGAR